MTMHDHDRRTSQEKGEDIASLREAELAEAEEMRARGTLTPEAAKQGVTSHLPEKETKMMYRSEEDESGKKT
jgi:hypothetical protein